MSKKYIWIGVGVVAIVTFLVWLFIESTKPLPGEKQGYSCDNFIDFSKLGDKDIEDKCRAHVPIGMEVNYPTNPPTHGPHYEDWIRAGVYTEPKDDRNMIHSLEHGYVIMSYNCSFKGGRGGISNVFAHGIDEEATGSGESTQSGKLSGEFKSDECHGLVDQLISLYEKKGKRKLIIVPRPNLDSKIALTAWQYLDKFDSFDSVRVEKFIDAHRDNGPERTME